MKQYVSMAKAAEALDVSPRTIRAWIAEGRLSAYRVGGRLVRLDADEIEQMISVRIPTAQRRQ